MFKIYDSHVYKCSDCLWDIVDLAPHHSDCLWDIVDIAPHQLILLLNTIKSHQLSQILPWDFAYLYWYQKVIFYSHYTTYIFYHMMVIFHLIFFQPWLTNQTLLIKTQRKFMNLIFPYDFRYKEDILYWDIDHDETVCPVNH